VESRIEELRRRVEKDPASIAFAQLAEEYRRAGHYEESVRVARRGLERHPGYVSARVTMGRALIALQRVNEAYTELQEVVQSAPENLAAIRALAEIHQHPDFAPLPAPPAVEPEPARQDAKPETADRAPLDEPSALQSREIEEPYDPVLEALERWLQQIQEDRLERASEGQQL
jgi:tetratricopeptide (TPR) repeat protein